MTKALVLENFSLSAQGPTVNLHLMPGQSLAIVGPSGSGKSRLLKCLAGSEAPAQGTVHTHGKPAVAGRDGFSRRSNAEGIAKAAASSKKANHAAEALNATHLFEARKHSLSTLTSGQLAACELLSCLVPESKLLISDGQIDRLDPWTLSSVWALLNKRLASGVALVVSTNRPELLPQFDYVILLDAMHPLFAGRFEELLERIPLTKVEVESKMQPGTRAMVKPFKIDVSQANGSTVFRAEDGQHLAAKLLLEGYGDVDFVVMKQATPEQALLTLTKTPVKKLKN